MTRDFIAEAMSMRATQDKRGKWQIKFPVFERGKIVDFQFKKDDPGYFTHYEAEAALLKSIDGPFGVAEKMTDTELMDFMDAHLVMPTPVGKGKELWTIGGVNLNMIREFRGDERTATVADPKFFPTARACIAAFAEWYRNRKPVVPTSTAP